MEKFTKQLGEQMIKSIACTVDGLLLDYKYKCNECGTWHRNQIGKPQKNASCTNYILNYF